MLSRMTLFYLVGPPAVGKLTVAREIERRTGAVVVDNHLVNDPVFVPMGTHRPGGDLDPTDELRRRVLEVVHEATAGAPASYSHVFTNWLTDDAQDAQLLGRLRLVAGRRSTRFVPVWLTAAPEVLAERVVSPQRSERAKLTDPEVLKDLLRRPVLPPPDDALILDTTTIQAGEAADQILESCRAD